MIGGSDFLDKRLVTVGELSKELRIDPDDILSLVRLGAVVCPLDVSDSGTWEDCIWHQDIVDTVVIPDIVEYLLKRWRALEKAIKDNCTVHIHGHDMMQDWAKEAVEGHRDPVSERIVAMFCKFEPKGK